MEIIANDTGHSRVSVQVWSVPSSRVSGSALVMSRLGGVSIRCSL